MKKVIKASSGDHTGAKVYLNTLDEFEPWSGAVENFERITEEDKLDELDNLIAELYPDGISVTGLNDLLWFEWEYVFESLGIEFEREE